MMAISPQRTSGTKRRSSLMLGSPMTQLPSAAALFGTELVDLSRPPASKRKRVHFEEDNETRDVKRRVADLPHLPSSQLSKCERSELWMTQADYEATLRAVLNDVVAVKDSHENDQVSVGSCYTEAMAQTYSLCCSPDVKGTIALENVALLSLLDSSFRGLENHTLPKEMRTDRKIRKAKTVSRVLELQGELRVAGNPKEDATECLRLVSEYFSEPSRKFARALGEIDGTFAHLAELTNSV
ncbi:expressed unknown protein [Seminavis robusta]|uniref:Uncharacterized protein n=1 Tax=Seminavis robusta TaxID=568900 RepID=A0A9N8DDC3_9STRA|nr:expressed unknown protein [Seminavis robusta]|eukprot:Sro43_g026010.1 n/a (241) ;mRNA; f:32973-33695